MTQSPDLKLNIPDEAWQLALDECGSILRKGMRDDTSTIRTRVLARSYTLDAASSRLNLRRKTLEAAISANLISAFIDPEGVQRIAAHEVHHVMEDDKRYEEIALHEIIAPEEIATALQIELSQVNQWIQEARIPKTRITWEKIRGQWNLPKSLRKFRAQLEDVRQAIKRAAQRARSEERRRRLIDVRREEQTRRRELRQKLVNSFPAWRHEGRDNQLVTLHVGPPNSGKTYQSLQELEIAGSGWYLAPLRLLAFEIFDRLNARGTPCNLLTGEEYIPIPGATITSATIEMFNAAESGEMVIIDEAQMLADPDRGWAWTRALMEAQSPDIHIIAPPTAKNLIEQLAESAGMPIRVVQHERLAPIKIADFPWSLENMPPRTILVAFSRSMVLHLKSELEHLNRRVSIVYGNLPPEVRRKQADRFANGETEICVATDAVGMGLNLPADYVCFYEVEKFDGKFVRPLTAGEVQQIGGRAGRYGLSQAGEVGATTRKNLNLIRRLFYQTPQILTHARVAPTVEDLQMIPGTLAEQLIQWSELQSIPDTLRDKIRTADMAERIELAKMLSDAEVRFLGLESAIKLINAPTNKFSRNYWRDCASAIIANVTMPLPPTPPDDIRSVQDLEATETSVSCADIYLWLANRREFSHLGEAEYHVRNLRSLWSERIDDALVLRLDTSKRCPECGKPLPATYRYKLCDSCFYRKGRGYY
jgi:ATP-dependent RNA helicase SUPV3L1/SUV3